MRILHILDHSIPLHSGYSFRTLAILEHQRRLGWETAHITSSKHDVATAPEEDVEGWHFYRTLPVGGLMERVPAVNQLAVIATLSKRLREVIREVKPDILHAHSPCLNGVAALSVARRFKLPLVYEVRALWEDGATDQGTSSAWGPRYRATRALETYVLRRADAVTTICEGLRNEIVARGIPERKLTVIPNAVDPERFTVLDRPDPTLVRQLGLEGKRVLGFIGSFYHYEGLSLLLDALPKMLKRMPDIRLVLVGGGMEEEQLKRQAAGSGIADKVLFTGRVPHAEIAAYYGLMEILIYPRLRVRLTDLVTPLKPLEAMAQGSLVVASDVGGHQEIIRHGETGLLFRAGNPESLAAAVLELLEHPERSAIIRAAARRYVERERNWTASVARYARVYESVLV